jgi:hypothetical protein
MLPNFSMLELIKRENVSASDPIFSEQPELDCLGETHVAKQGEHQNWPVHRR